MDYRFEIETKTVVYKGFFQMEKYRLRHELFAGGMSPLISRECLERGQAVAVLPYDPQRDRVVLIEQFRVGALAQQDGPWLLEIVAGIIGPGESKLEVARREAMEEAGCELLDILPVCEYLVSPGGTTEGITLYCGRVDSTGIGGVHGLAEEHEDIRVLVVSSEEALALLHSGRVLSATTLIALQWLALQREALRERWGQTAKNDAQSG
ncbi:MAG: NUDIX domain-containing protein [Candidatus Competibacteraceae bacterium]